MSWCILPFLVGPNFGDRTISTEKTIDEMYLPDTVDGSKNPASFKLQIV